MREQIVFYFGLLIVQRSNVGATEDLTIRVLDEVCATQDHYGSCLLNSTGEGIEKSYYIYVRDSYELHDVQSYPAYLDLDGVGVWGLDRRKNTEWSNLIYRFIIKHDISVFFPGECVPGVIMDKALK